MRPTYLVAMSLLVAACGSRTEISATFNGQDGAAPTRVAFAPGCSNGRRDWLVFDLSATQSGLYAIRANRSDGHFVQFPHSPMAYPSISPDGSTILYASFTSDAGVDGGNDSVLYAYDLTTRTTTQILTAFQLTYAALSPDNRTIAYTSGLSLFASGADGSNQRALLVGGCDGNCNTAYGHPMFAGDSRTILYGSTNQLGTIASDGSNDQVLLSASNEYPNGGFSGDYQQVVVGVACSDPAVVTLSVYPYPAFPSGCDAGEVLANVNYSLGPNAGANDPAWNPNGLIAYASGQDVFVIDGSGGAPENVSSSLTGMSGAATDPIWVPACATLP